MDLVGKLLSMALSLFLGSFFANTAWGLGWTNCHNAEKKITRTEIEMWGANPVVWKIDGKALGKVQEFFDKNTKKTLSVDPLHDTSFGPGKKEIYAIEVMLKEKEKDEVIVQCEVTCHSFQYPRAID